MWEWLDDLGDAVDEMADTGFVDNQETGRNIVIAFGELDETFRAKNKAIAEIIGGFKVSNFELYESLIAQSNAFESQRVSIVRKFNNERNELINNVEKLGKFYNELHILYGELLRFEKFVIKTQQDPEFREEVGNFEIDTDSGISWWVWLIVIGVGGYIGYRYLKKG
jgi:hypothetical protein